MNATQRLQVIDSHTGGEPTRVVVAGGPDLGGGSMAECRALLVTFSVALGLAAAEALIKFVK